MNRTAEYKKKYLHALDRMYQLFKFGRQKEQELEKRLKENELIFVGYTNGHQILYGAQSEGVFYSDTENDCFIPLYMMKRHEHRLQTTSNMQVTLEKIQEANGKGKKMTCQNCGSTNLKTEGFSGTQSCYGGYGYQDVDVDVTTCLDCGDAESY